MQIGSLVRYKDDGDLGIIIDINLRGDCRVKWSDGVDGYFCPTTMEVICE